MAGPLVIAKGMRDANMYDVVRVSSQRLIGEIIEIIDGPFEIAQCLCEDFDCTRVQDKRICQFRQIFDRASRNLHDELHAIKMSQFQ